MPHVMPQRLHLVLSMLFMLLLSLCGLPHTQSQNTFGEPRLVGPYSIQCVEDGMNMVQPLLIDSYWSNDTLNEGLNDYVQLLVNVSVSYGTISFSNLRNVKFYASTNANMGASQYALIGKRQWMVPAMKSMSYSANSALPSGSLDTINMTIQQQISKMGEWVVEHDIVGWVTHVEITSKTTLPIFANSPSRLSTESGNILPITGVNVTWETGESNDMLLLSASVNNGQLSFANQVTLDNDEKNGCNYNSNTYLSQCSVYTTYGSINEIVNSLSFTANNASIWKDIGITDLLLSIDVINNTHADLHNENITMGSDYKVTTTIPLAILASNTPPSVSIGAVPTIVINEMIIFNSVDPEKNIITAAGGISNMFFRVADADLLDTLYLNFSSQHGHFASWSDLELTASTMNFNISDPLGGHGSLLPSSEAYSSHLHTLDTMNARRFNALLSDKLLENNLLSTSKALFGPIEYLNSMLSQIVYIPSKDFYGMDVISYNVSDVVEDTIGSISVVVTVPEDAPYFDTLLTFKGIEDEDVEMVGVEISGRPVNVDSYIVQLSIQITGGSVSFYEESALYPSDFIGNKVKVEGDCTTSVKSNGVYTCSSQTLLTLTGESSHVNMLLSNFTFSPADHLNNLTSIQPSMFLSVAEYDIKRHITLSETTYAYITIDLLPVNDIPAFYDLPTEISLLEEQVIFPFKGSGMTIDHNDIEEETTNLDLVLTLQSDHGKFGLSIDKSSDRLWGDTPLTHMSTITSMHR